MQLEERQAITGYALHKRWFIKQILFAGGQSGCDGLPYSRRDILAAQQLSPTGSTGNGFGRALGKSKANPVAAADINKMANQPLPDTSGENWRVSGS